MDEPSATLTEKEQALMFSTVRSLRDAGVTIIYISHRLEEIFDLCNNVTVLRDGQHIATLPVSSVTQDELVSLMVGRTVTREYPDPPAPGAKWCWKHGNSTARVF